MARRACLSIGVSTVTPERGRAMRFGFLDGAIVAAKAFGEWALLSGFGDANVRVVTDERVDGTDNPVTRARVQAAVDQLFPDGAETVDQLILSFCGHGLTDANVGAISWLFSDSLQQKYRVVSDAFYTELLLTGVKRITLITDACREAPKDLDLMRLDSSRGVVLAGDAVESPMFDRLAACQDGQLGYMLADPASADPGKCVFSGVIADALWGREPAAIHDGVITTATLAVCVRSRAAERAKEYRLKISPQCQVDPLDAVLYDAAHPPGAQPDLQPWPPAAAAAPMGLAPANPVDARTIARNFDLLIKDDAFRGRILGNDFGGIALDGTGSMGPATLAPGSRKILHDLVERRTAPSIKSRPKGGALGRRQEKAMVRIVEVEAVRETRRKAAIGVRRRLVQLRPAAGPDGSNVIVSGQGKPAIWSATRVTPGRRTAARAGYNVAPGLPGAPILVELSDGRFTPVVPYDDLYAVVTASAATEIFQAYGERHDNEAFKHALAAVADFAAGKLGPGEVDRLAAMLRARKHADPVLGAICAHLYRAVADIDSIRRMAWFYAEHAQPVPFDIALLGAMEVTRDDTGELVLHIPAVKARPDPPGPKLPGYVTRACPAARASVGGKCPWLAIGWDHVGLVRTNQAALVEGLQEHASAVRRSGFTVLPEIHGRALARLWGLARRQP